MHCTAWMMNINDLLMQLAFTVSEAPGILVRRYDPKMVILDLFVLRVFRLICMHNYRIE